MSTQAAHDRFLSRDDARLRWRIEGAGPAVVLLHGWALDLDYWNPVMPLLAKHFALLRFDRRGFGLSQGRPDPARDVADLAAVLDAAGVERAMVIGMSQGARLALRFAHTMAARAHALVLDGAPALDAEPELPLAQLRQLLNRAGNEPMQSAIRAHPLMRLQRDNIASRGLLDVMLARYRGLDLLHPPAPLPQPDVTAIHAPVLILTGSLDSPERLQAATALQVSMTEARCVQLPGAGHLALLDDPPGYAREVIAFGLQLPPW